MTADPRQAAIAELARAFASRHPGRSVAVASLRGGNVAVGARADVVRPAASLLKIPLVAAVHERAAAGELDLDAVVTRRELPATGFGTVLAAFDADHPFRLRELCALCLVASDNPCAEHLLGLVGLDAVNRTAAALAGPATRFVVGFGDAYLGSEGLVNTSTARESLRMIVRIVRDPRHAAVRAALQAGIRNPRIPLRLAQLRCTTKTGTLVGVVNDVGVLHGADHDLALAFLCSDQPDREATALEIGDCALAMWLALGDPHGFERRT